MSLDFCPDPILAAFDGYRGSIVDVDQAVTVDHADLAQATAELTRQLAAQGIERGDRVLVAIGNGPRFVSTLIAVLRAGGSPLLVHVETPPNELCRIAHRWGCRFLLADAHGEEALRPAGTACQTLAAGPWCGVVMARIDQDDAGFQDHFPRLEGVPLHPTSGTTGLPKIAVRPGRAAIAEATNYINTIGITADDTILAVPPMSHAYAYGLCVMASLVSGAKLVTTRRFSPKVVARVVQEHNITILPLVPAMLDLLLLAGASSWDQLPRCVLTAGSPLSERTATEFERQTGRVVQPLYGTTETGGISVASPDGPPAVNGNVGPAMRGVSAKLSCSADNGVPGGVGRLSIKSPSMMAGYLSPESIDSSGIVDGWLQTGDLAALDGMGEIHLKGRETEIINVFGLKVIPSEVEETLALIPEIVESKVYAGRHPSGSQIVKAAIVATKELNPRAVRAHCELHLAPYKRPEVITLVESLPRSPSGKIVRDQLP